MEEENESRNHLQIPRIERAFEAAPFHTWSVAPSSSKKMDFHVEDLVQGGLEGSGRWLHSSRFNSGKISEARDGTERTRVPRCKRRGEADPRRLRRRPGGL